MEKSLLSNLGRKRKLTISAKTAILFIEFTVGVLCMKCFQFDLRSTLQIELLNKEHLILPRKHVSRTIRTYILYFVTKGTLALISNGEECILHEGTVCLFEPGDTQEPLAAQECEYYFVHFNSPDIVALDLDPQAFLKCSLENRRQFAASPGLGFERYEHFHALIWKKTELSKEMAQSLAAVFEKSCIPFGESDPEKRLRAAWGLADILLKTEKYSTQLTSCGRTAEIKKLQLVTAVRQYLDGHFNEDIDGNDLEQRFLFQYDYLNRLFRQVTGESIIKYRNNQRIELAKFLLASSETEISDIAAQAGFGDSYYFVRYFKKTVGCSPTQFRMASK